MSPSLKGPREKLVLERDGCIMAPGALLRLGCSKNAIRSSVDVPRWTLSGGFPKALRISFLHGPRGEPKCFPRRMTHSCPLFCGDSL